MYAIMSGGALVALCSEPRYVRRNPGSGAWVQAARAQAEALAVNGELYNLPGGTAVPNAPEAVVREDDVAEYVFHNRARIVENGEAVAQLEDALCELDSVMNGG